MTLKTQVNLADIAHGEHCCLIYDTPEEQLEITVPYFAIGLSRDERCIFVGDPSSLNRLRRGLANQGIDLEKEINEKRLILSSAHDYLDNGRFSTDKMLSFLQQAYETAMADGFTALRAAGDVSWEMGPNQNFDDVVYYETLLDIFFLGKHMIGMCQYPKSLCPPHTISGILNTHRTAAIGTEICTNNVHYIPPTLLLEKDPVVRQEKRVEWMGSQLVRLKRAEEARERAIQDLLDEKREKEKLREQFLQAQKMEAVGQLAGGVAHDFNNILTAILGLSEFLLQNPGDKETMSADITEIKTAAQRAAVLTRQLLAFSRQQVLKPRILDLSVTIAEMDKMLRRVLNENIDLKTVVSPRLAAVKADPGQIEQVLMNLVVNARDAMPNGGRLTIELANVELTKDYVKEHLGASEGPHVMLAVSDTGAGMDKITISRLFEPFFTTKEKGKGTGLGLSTVYGIIKQSGGSIFVYSEIGKGSSFKVYLPQADEPAAVVATAQPSAAARGGTETILVVEDEEMVRKLLLRVLKQNGYHVLEARTPKEAIDICRENKKPIPLLMTDMVLPGMDGRTLARQLTSLYPAMKVIHMSGYTDIAMIHSGMLEPGFEFIEKPMTPDTICRRVRDVLDARPR
jgi:signal transduction histidine kinase/CheY-like chemotaxis protein